MSTVSLPVVQLVRRSDARQLDGKVVSAMADSIAAIGLLNPVRVRKAGDEYEVIAGAHRLAAHQVLGLVEIDCIVVDDDDLRAELAMIDENLCRAELSPSDRARQTARRKAIYLELHPETAHGANLEGAGVANLASPEAPAFAKATAQATGQSERTVQRDAERGEKVIDEVLDLIRGTKLDTGTYLDKIKKLPPNEQVAAAKRDLAVDKKQAKAERDAQRAEFDRQREANREDLRPEVKAAQARRDEAVAARKGRADDAIAALEAEIDELREANAALEAEAAALKADNAKWQDMKVQFEQGGFEKVIADRDEEIRVLQTRLETESADKASWMKSAKFWKAEAEKLGYGEDDVIPLAPRGGGHG